VSLNFSKDMSNNSNVEYRLLGAITTSVENQEQQQQQQLMILDQQNEQRINQLLQQWGLAVSSTTQVSEAKKQVDDYRKEHQQQQELFVYNPYRPQGGNGFPGKPMWTTLLAETSTFAGGKQEENTSRASISDNNMQSIIAKIFRVDPEHNAAILKELKKQDEIVEAALIG
jgi:hypothetical protein